MHGSILNSSLIVIKTNGKSRRETLLAPISSLLLSPCTKLDQTLDLRLLVAAIAVENRLVHHLSDILLQLRIQECGDVRGCLVGGEGNEAHGVLEILLELLVGGGAGSEIVASEVDGRDDVFLVGGGSAGADELDELETKEGEVKRVVEVENLLRKSQQLHPITVKRTAKF